MKLEKRGGGGINLSQRGVKKNIGSQLGGAGVPLKKVAAFRGSGSEHGSPGSKRKPIAAIRKKKGRRRKELLNWGDPNRRMEKNRTSG